MNGVAICGVCRGIDGGPDERMAKLNPWLHCQQTTANRRVFRSWRASELNGYSLHEFRVARCLGGCYQEEYLSVSW